MGTCTKCLHVGRNHVTPQGFRFVGAPAVPGATIQTAFQKEFIPGDEVQKKYIPGDEVHYTHGDDGSIGSCYEFDLTVTDKDAGSIRSFKGLVLTENAFAMVNNPKLHAA